MNRVIVTRPIVGIFRMQVCAAKDATDEEVLEVANDMNPAGTTKGWTSVVREGKGAPVPCVDFPDDRVHLILEC